MNTTWRRKRLARLVAADNSIADESPLRFKNPVATPLQEFVENSWRRDKPWFTSMRKGGDDVLFTKTGGRDLARYVGSFLPAPSNIQHPLDSNRPLQASQVGFI